MSPGMPRQRRITELLEARARIDGQLALLLRTALHSDDEDDDDDEMLPPPMPRMRLVEHQLTWQQIAAANQLALAIIYGRGIRSVTHARRRRQDADAWTTS